MLCEEDYDNYQVVLKNKVFHNLLHSSIITPALIDALYYIDSPEAKDNDKKRWYKELKRIKSESKVHDCFKIAQNILEQPNERNLSTLITLMEETNIDISSINKIELRVFTESYTDKLHRDVKSTDNIENYLKDLFPYEVRFPKGSTNIFIKRRF